MDPSQHIIVTEGDFVAVSLMLMVKGYRPPLADIHVINGLGFGTKLPFSRAMKWVGDMRNGTGNILPDKIQVHELPAFFTLCSKEEALTRPQVNRYLALEEQVRDLSSFKNLSSDNQRRLLSELVEKFDVQTGWREQCDEVKHRCVRRLSTAAVGQITALVHWNALRNYVRSRKFRSLVYKSRSLDSSPDNANALKHASETSYSIKNKLIGVGVLACLGYYCCCCCASTNPKKRN